MVHRSPVRKFAKASEGVGHRHKLPKLVEESNNLISLSIPIQGHGLARRMPVTRNAPFSLVFSAIRKENYQYVFRGKVAKWEYIAPEPLYGDFTTETWRKLYVRINDNPESRYRYVADGTAFRDDADFDKFKKNYEATVFNHSDSMLVVWCFRDKTEFLQEDEWNRLDLPMQERMYNGQLVKVKIKKDMERHVTTFYRIELPPITY